MNLEVVEDPEDPRIADFRGVRDPEWLRRRRLFLAEGRSIVRILLGESRFRARSLLVTETALADLKPILETCRSIPCVYLATGGVMAGVSGVRFHQGCVAVAETGAELSCSAALQAAEGSSPLTIVLEDVTDPDNVGAVFRSGFAFGAGSVMLSSRSTSPLYRKAIRTSMGATLRLPFARLPSWPDDLARLRSSGYALLALSPTGPGAELEELGAQLAVPERVALLLGSEGDGLSAEALRIADLRLRIPMRAEADSINVATAAAIALQRLYALRRPGV